jgi:hypothetical protein
VFYDGSDEDAFILSGQSNVEHGLPLSPADRTTAAERIIARVTGLSPKTVAAVRKRSTAEIPHLRARVGRDGRTRPVDAADGRRLVGDLLTENPDASIRQIALRAGISQGTARATCGIGCGAARTRCRHREAGHPRCTRSTRRGPAGTPHCCRT